MIRNLLQKASLKLGIIASALLIIGGLSLNLAQTYAANISISSPVNCDNNSVIYCGAESVNELINKYDNGDTLNSTASIHNIYSSFGITADDISSMNSGSNGETVEAGSVTKSGDVYDGSGTLVASNALTAGRENIAGSTIKTVNGTTFYTRAPSVSFLDNKLSAYVVMKDSKFAYAILVSCGNPVSATPTPKPTPTPAPTPAPTPTPKPTPTPAPTPAPTPSPTPTPPTSTTTTSICSGNTVNINTGLASQGGNCSTNTTIVQNTPPAPAGQCTGLDIDVLSNNPLEVSATANSSVSNGATLSSVVFDFGDGTTTAPSTDTSATHTYATDEDYTITATESFTGSQSVPDSICQAALTVTSPPPATATPTATTTPTPVVTTAAAVTPVKTTAALVNTGPGNDIALFGITSLIGFLGYRTFLLRRS